ncbi:MAG TPA: TIGR03016 family PEP-CTERM system-associated outer membrane protein [Accumulibacter sp.]|uniref:TIGR03016 family PEP-CTERM system-associated outer membrane protein n=1 Tax=Accumulibacter sp. TaxID=2053492 RepID=UPI002C5183BD|nr:TIGR03016 family PEP-CTERM system-associated outer membrane protein [Accumulibacter sp.]HRD86748.1 TIGR03016 family PEP-CTERM system-associated outer membrane protein [Accumulibacter sp.]
MATVRKVLEVAAGAPGGAMPSPASVSGRWSSAASRSSRRGPRITVRLAWALSVLALPAQAENWTITPSIAVGETLTNNLYLTSTNRTSDLVTSITPGISIDGRGGRTSLRLGYSITQNIYARESSENNRQQGLVAVGTLEAVEDWLFVDASATISQQYISAFGGVAPSNANIDRNRTETFYYSVSPYIRGRLLSSADYLLRYSVSGTNPDSQVVSNTTTSQWLGRLNGDTRWSALSWSVDASSNSANYDVGRDRNDTRYGLTLAYRFNPELQVSAIVGREKTNLVSREDETNNDSGFGLVWTPSPRTKLDGRVTRRFFGDGYNVAFSHRMPLSALNYSASRDVSYQPAGVTNTGQGSNYDAFYAIVAANNPGLAPEAIRAQVNQIVQGRGVPADGSVVNGYLTNRPSLQTQQQISYALLGVRNTLTFNASESQQQPLGVISGLTDDYSLANEVTQRGYGVIWGHQLTGLSSLSLSLNQQRSLAKGSGAVDSKTTGAYLLFTTSLGPRTNANVGARHVISDGGVNADYTESALTASLSHSF